MKPTSWTLVPLRTTRPDRRHWHNRFTGVKDMTDTPQIVVPSVPRPTTAELEQIADSMRNQMEPPTIFTEVIGSMGFDPFAPVVMPPRSDKEKARALRAAHALTQRVWVSINQDGTIDPDKAVPLTATGATVELPIVKKSEDNDVVAD